MSHQKRRRWAETLLAEVRGLRADLARDRRERHERDIRAAIIGAAFVRELYAAQPYGLDDKAVDRALEEAVGAADWAEERRGAS